MERYHEPRATHHTERCDEEFCRRRHITKLAVFGSYLREDFGPDGDIDLLVEFDPKRTPILFDIADMDLRTPQDLSRYFRDEVVAHAEAQSIEE
jgi:predicted nucleotidyltransferase